MVRFISKLNAVSSCLRQIYVIQQNKRVSPAKGPDCYYSNLGLVLVCDIQGISVFLEDSHLDDSLSLHCYLSVCS